MKAWKIDARNDTIDYIEVVFAEARGQAIQKSNCIKDWVIDYIDVRAKRIPAFDDCPQPILPIHFIERGYGYACGVCGESAYLTDREGMDGGWVGVSVNESGDVFHSCCAPNLEPLNPNPEGVK